MALQSRRSQVIPIIKALAQALIELPQFDAPLNRAGGVAAKAPTKELSMQKANGFEVAILSVRCDFMG